MTTTMIVQDFDMEKIELMKQTVARGVTDMEFELFLHACKRTGLDPLMKQIHAIKRWDSRLQREAMSIQTGIDGYRLIADRTGNYAPGPKPSFTYDDGGAITSATAYIKKRTADGVWHVVEGEAFWEEYVQTTKQGEVTSMWKKGHMMLAKCAEALALRKAFPAELSRVYTHEEMMQAENHQERKPLRTGSEMLKAIEEKAEAPPSVHEPAVEEVMEDIEKAAALSMPTPGNPPSIFGFTDKLDNTESIKEWSDVMNEAQRYDWNAEQRTRLDDHAQRAKKRLTTKAKK